MRRVLFAVLGVVCVCAGYVTSPLYSAWALREAIRAGDADYIEPRVHWPTVRSTLRVSMNAYAAGLSGDEVIDIKFDRTPTTLWQRIKLGFSSYAVNNIVQSYVTPAGLSQLFTVRQGYRDYVAGDPYADMSLLERAHKFWSRLRRAEFHDLTTFELELEDKYDPTRAYVGIMKLSGFTWRLTELRLKRIGDEA